MLAAGAGEVPSASDGDRTARRELVHHDACEARHRLGQEHRFGADAYDIAALRERRNELAVDPMVALELRRTGRLQRILRESRARAEPAALLILGEPRPVGGQRESASPLRKALLPDETFDERVEALRRQAERRAHLLARRARA